MSVLPPSSRDKILDVAEALFARRGCAGVGLREVAAAAGLSKSSLFHHFRGKTQLYYEVLGRELRRIQARVEPVLAAPGPPAERLERAVDGLCDTLAEHPPSARLLLRALFEEEDFPEPPTAEAEEAERVLAEIIAAMRALLREGIERGDFRDVSVTHTLQSLIGATVYHFASGEFGELLFGRPVLSAEAVRRRKAEVKELFRRGLAPEPA